MATNAFLPRHPITGLYALGFTSRGPIWPVLGGEESEDAAAQAAAAQAAAEAQAAERGFPADTPWRDMKPEQQAAYWQHQARRHEGRVSALGNITPEALAELQTKAAKAEEYEAANGTDTEKAVQSAYTTAEKAAADKYQPLLVRARFDAAVGDRLDSAGLDAILDPLDLSKFLAADGTPDIAKINDYANKIAPAKTEQYQRRGGPSPSGQGHHGAAAGKPGDSARAALAKRGIKVATD